MSKLPDRDAVVFFALGDETRLGVVRRLAAAGGLSATALAEGAAVSRQAIVKHLGVLERAGIVVRRRAGREVLYHLEPLGLVDARAFIDGISAGWDRALERLRDLVEDGDV
jgi:DNA-binding transcriptional ArsR family regulator